MHCLKQCPLTCPCVPNTAWVIYTVVFPSGESRDHSGGLELDTDLALMGQHIQPPGLSEGQDFAMGEAPSLGEDDADVPEAPPGEDRDDDVDVEGGPPGGESDTQEHGVDPSTAERVQKSWQNEGESAHDMFL